ncbi:origin recognition complex subunit 3 N-terminus-domain-containing protein [Mycena amicta]|nr:origin recognition complex subunit 3 N-terminus-domain-containing protein [Mycena amicta]
MLVQLEDPHQTLVSIPFQPDEEPVDSQSSFEYDLPNGPLLRLDAYTAVWTRCLDRIKSIMIDLYSPVVSTVIETLGHVHTDILSGLPFPELPVIAVSDLSGGSLFLDLLGTRVEEDSANFVVSHVYPADCQNVAKTMKTIIGGFIDGDEDAPKRKPGALALFDIELLQAWYDQAADLRLVVLLHDFEQFDRRVLQDVFYIFSLRLSSLPLVFVVLLSTPSPPTYLQASLPRSTLTLLRPYHFAVPAGRPLLDSILFGTFFDPTINLPFFPGPTLLEFVEEYYETHNASVDALISAIQVGHMHHFSTNVLSLLAQRTPPLLGSAALYFAQALLDRLNTQKNSKKQEEEDWRKFSSSPSDLIQAVDNAREAFFRHAQDTKLGFALLRIAMESLSQRRDKLIERWRGPARMCRALANGYGVNGLAGLLKKLAQSELLALVGKLHEYFQAAPLELRQAHLELRSDIVALRSTAVDDAGEIARAIEGMIGDLFKPFEEATALWDVWYTAETPFPSELINPALRSSIVSGLSFPPRVYARPREHVAG